jgi:hypothetical protein
MSRVALVIAASAAVIGSVLAGCSGSSVSMPEWLSSKPSPPPLQTLQFQSQPPGAEVRTAKGQTCQTPCSLQVQPESQPVTFEKGGFVSQTVQVSVAERAEHSFFSKDPPPNLIPNPVQVALQAVPQPTIKPRHRKTLSHNINRRTPKPPAQQAAGDTPLVQQQ